MCTYILECFCSESSMYASRLAITLVSATTYSKPKSLRPLYNSPPWRYVWTIFFKILTPKKMHEISGFFHWNNSCAWTTCPIGIVEGSYENWHAWLNSETQKLGWVNSRAGQFWKNPAWTLKNSWVFPLKQLLCLNHLSYWDSWWLIWKLTCVAKFWDPKIRVGQF